MICDRTSSAKMVFGVFQIVFIASLFILVSGCASVGGGRSLPPVLTQDEVVRPYQKVAVLEVTRERYGSSEDINPGDYEWAYQALREQAAKLNADAVILPEIKVEIRSYILFPSSDIKAKGVAIKFR